MERGRAAGEGDAVGPIADRGELCFECVDVGPEWGDPAALEGTVEGRLVGESGVGWGEIDAAHRMLMRLPEGPITALTQSIAGGRTAV